MSINEYPERIKVSKWMNISRDPVYSVESPAPIEDAEEKGRETITYIRADLKFGNKDHSDR